jgi:BirA family biotin operon repressor/biotin-[acetyl-CoA-carboxylase] ligase
VTLAPLLHDDGSVSVKAWARRVEKTMHILCDSYDYAAELLPPELADGLTSTTFPSDPSARTLARAFLGADGVAWAGAWPGQPWAYLVLSRFAPRSQYDQMIDLARRREGLPGGIVCVAGAGEGFHGFKGRRWSAAPGNLHVTVHLAPARPIERFDTAFTVLAALSVVDAVESVPGLEGLGRIKWVNDILIDGAKVAGILAYTQTQVDRVTSAVLGIGLNVETAPEVPRTAEVPAVGALRDFQPGATEVTQRGMLWRLMEALHRNYQVLLRDGYRPLLERYRRRSGIVGSHVTVCAEDSGPEPTIVAEGTVMALGDGLELHLDTQALPVRRGRLLGHRQVAAARR